MQNEVVARFIDGRLVKGSSFDVAPAKPVCHVKTEESGVVQVAMKDLKALFFVKDLEGDAERQEGTIPAEGDPRLRGSKRLEITFKDGELMVGLANRFPPTGTFFYVVPIDSDSNNVRVLVNRDATESISLIQE